MSISGNWEKRRVEDFERLGTIDRRMFVRLSGMSAAALVFGAGPFTEKAVAAISFSSYPFKLGIASGDPRPDGVVLWTRLAPRPQAADGRGGMPNQKVLVRWEVANDEGFRNVVAKGSKYARPELAHSVHAEVGGLASGADFFYRFKAGTEISPVGRTRTAPAAGSAVAQVSFAFASCQQYEHGYYTAYSHMAREDLDFVFHLGDYIYEYGPDEYLSASGNARRHNSPEIRTLAAYRNRYAQYKRDGSLRAAHAAFPWIVTWDDHEVENNYAAGISENNEPRTTFLKRRAAAYRAYYEHMPLRRSSVPQGPDMRIYRRINYGNLAQFNILDTRQYRHDQAGNEGRDRPNAEQRDPARSITGATQESWLLNGLAASTARWKVLAQQVFFSKRDFDTATGALYSMDAWDGYLGSRDRILNFMRERNVQNPIVLTGDVHNNWAADLKADFSNPDSQTLGVEVVGTSVSSGGDGADSSPAQRAVLAENPHLKFFNGQRGYVRCRMTPETFHTAFRVMPYVSRRGAAISTRATFVVEAGNPGLQRQSTSAPVGTTESAALVESDAERIAAQEEASEG